MRKLELNAESRMRRQKTGFGSLLSIFEVENVTIFLLIIFFKPSRNKWNISNTLTINKLHPASEMLQSFRVRGPRSVDFLRHHSKAYF